MQSGSPSKKWSDIKGLAAVTIDTGKKVGTIDDFYFNHNTNTIQSFVVKTGLFSHLVLPAAAVKGIGEDALTFTSEDQLSKQKDAEKIDQFLLGRDLLSYRVLSEGGNVIGTVSNIILNIAAPELIQITGFELPGNLRERFSQHYPTFQVEQVTRFGEDVLVIPNDVAQTL
jgi:sporulation protein YlmC with PRC-barrel domain